MRRIITLLLLAVHATGAAPQRIISTAPSITETLFAMGLGPRVVGVTIYCKFPPEAAALPKIGTFLKPDAEAILALKPDLVVVQKQPNHLREELERLHVSFVEVESKNLDAVYSAARTIGKAAGATAAAERLIAGMQASLNGVQQQAAAKPKPAVAFLVGHTAGRLEGLIAGSGSSYFSDLLTYAGGTNIFGNVAVPYPKISLEEILSRDPDVIMELAGGTDQSKQEILNLWRAKTMLKAVRGNRVYALDSGPFLVPGPRAVEAARIVLHLLHPELRP